MLHIANSMMTLLRRTCVCGGLLAFALSANPVAAYAWQGDHGAEAAAEDHAAEDHAAEDHAENSHESAEDDHGDQAGHGEDHGHAAPPLLSVDLGSAVCNIAIFLGVFFILAKFVWPVVLDGLKARESKIYGDLEAAEQANKEAKALLQQYQAKLDDAAAQVQGMLAEARKDAEATGQRIVAEAKEEAERQRERALADIETAKKVALSELAAQTSDIAIRVAKQVVGRELKPDDHADLIKQALQQLPSNN